MRCRRGNVTDFTDNQHNIDLINRGRLRHDRPKEIPTILILNIKLLASTILIGRHLKPSFYSSLSVALGLIIIIIYLFRTRGTCTCNRTITN